MPKANHIRQTRQWYSSLHGVWPQHQDLSLLIRNLHKLAQKRSYTRIQKRWKPVKDPGGNQKEPNECQAKVLALPNWPLWDRERPCEAMLHKIHWNRYEKDDSPARALQPNHRRRPLLPQRDRLDQESGHHAEEACWQILQRDWSQICFTQPHNNYEAKDTGLYGWQRD